MTISQVALTPFGVGTDLPTSSAPPTGDSGTRYLNPATRDYQIDATTGQAAQMPSKRQRVLLAVLTLQGSSTVDIGRGIKPPRKMGPTFVVEMQQAVRYALREMTTSEKSILIDGVDVITGAGGRALVTIRFTDTDTGEADDVTANIAIR